MVLIQVFLLGTLVRFADICQCDNIHISSGHRGCNKKAVCKVGQDFMHQEPALPSCGMTWWSSCGMTSWQSWFLWTGAADLTVGAWAATAYNVHLTFTKNWMGVGQLDLISPIVR